MRDRFAPTTRRTRASRTRTLCTLISKAGHELTPATVEGIYAVAAALKEGGYRTGRAYLGLWETMHREAGHPWTDDLVQAKAWARKSIERGMGPAISAAAVDVETWAAAARPGDDYDMIVIGTLWMLRGAEVAALLVEQARVGPGALVATLSLGAHKTNTEAATCERALRCTCRSTAAASSGEAPLGVRICPSHAVARVLARRGLGLTGGTGAKHPLFPGRGGRARTPAG